MARVKKVKLISKDGAKRELPKEDAERVLAWCEKNNVGLWRLDKEDKKDE